MDLLISGALDDVDKTRNLHFRAHSDDLLIGTKQAARYLGVTDRTMRRLAEELNLGRKIGGQWKFWRNHVLAFLPPRNTDQRPKSTDDENTDITDKAV